MEEARKAFEELKGNIKEYIEIQTNYYYLRFVEKISALTAQGGIFITILLAIFMFFLLLSMAFAFLFNYLMNSVFAGFFIISALYLLFILVLIWQQDKLKVIIMNAVIKAMFVDDEEIDSEEKKYAEKK
jgi:hypothetical protein